MIILQNVFARFAIIAEYEELSDQYWSNNIFITAGRPP